MPVRKPQVIWFVTRVISGELRIPDYGYGLMITYLWLILKTMLLSAYCIRLWSANVIFILELVSARFDSGSRSNNSFFQHRSDYKAPSDTDNLNEVRLRYPLESFSKPRRRRRRECHQTNDLMSRTMAMHVRFESFYISLPSSAKQQREMTKFYVFWRKQTAVAKLWYLL